MSALRETRHQMLKQAGIYSLGTQVTQLITLVAAILSRRFLGPAQTGIWAALQVIVDYSKYSTLGTMDAASREIPTAMGRGDQSRADQIKNLTFTFVTSSSCIISFAILSAAWILHPWISRQMTFGLCFVAGVVFLQRLNNLFVATLRCYKQFHIEALFMLLSAVVNAFLVATLTYFFKIYGFIWALMLSFVFNIGYLHFSYAYRFKWVFNWNQLKPLMAYGLPLMALGVIVTILKSIDKILIAKFLGFESLGVYSIALMACSYLGNFSISIAIVLLPYSQEKYGQRGDARDLGGFLLKSSRAYAYSLPLLIGLAWFFVPLAIWLVLPKFTEGTLAMKILTLNLFFAAQLQPFHDFLITIKKHFQLFPLLIALVMTACAADFTVIRMGGGIEGVAWVTVAVFFGYFTAVLFMAGRYFSGGAASVVPHYFKVCAVFGYMSLVLFSLQGDFLNRPSQESLFYVGGVALFLVAYLPLAALLNHNFSLWAILSKKIRNLLFQSKAS